MKLPFSVKLFRVLFVGFRTLICGFVCLWHAQLFQLNVVCFQLLIHFPHEASALNYFSGDTRIPLSAITTIDAVPDSTPAAVVTELDEDSAFTEAQDNLRVLLSQRKRHSVEMHASTSVGEEENPVARDRC